MTDEYIRSNSNKNSCGSYVLIYNNYLTCNTTYDITEYLVGGLCLF